MSAKKISKVKNVSTGSRLFFCASCNEQAAICSPQKRRIGLWLVFAIAILFVPLQSHAQQWYYHTAHSSSLALQYGRTYKLTYAYQLSRVRQLKISGMYVFDEFDNGPDRVKSDVYNVNLQFQYNLLHVDKAFFGLHVGGGGYILKAGNLVDQRHKERKLNALFGLQGEYFINKSSMALVADYDVLYLPFSDLYEFLHLPRVGVKFVF